MNNWYPLNPRSWQIEAWDKWEASEYRGTIEADTGAGKTYLGLMALHFFSNKKILIVVHTKALMYQWQKEIKKVIGIDTGLIGDNNIMSNHRVIVAIVNSIRQADLDNFPVFILDECHHYMSEINKLFVERHTPYALLALSATVGHDNGIHKQFVERYPIIYEIGQKECIDKGWLCNYDIVNMACKFSATEQIEYNKNNLIVRQFWHKYGNIGNIKKALKRFDKTAGMLMKAISKRRQILMNSPSKIIKTAELILKDKDTKTIVFGEYKISADKLFRILERHNISCGIYHSGKKTKKNKMILEQFKNDEFKILITVKALDEGLDVPSVSKEIIMGSSNQKRQTKQRFGRGLRNEEGKHATIIQLYIHDTKDEKDLRKRTIQFKGIATRIIWCKDGQLPVVLSK